MRGVFDDKGIGVQAKEVYTSRVWICIQNKRIYEQNSNMKELNEISGMNKGV